jgi:hypothetical protein
MSVLNIHAPTEDKIGVKDSFYKEEECVHHTKILLWDINDKVGRKDNFTTSKHLTVKSKMFLLHNSHKFTWASPARKTHNQIDNILLDKKWTTSVLDVQLFRPAVCDTDCYLVVEKVKERLAVNKQR